MTFEAVPKTKQIKHKNWENIYIYIYIYVGKIIGNIVYGSKQTNYLGGLN